MERFDPAIQRCPFRMLCMASGVALLIFLFALLLLG